MLPCGVSIRGLHVSYCPAITAETCYVLSVSLHMTILW